MEGTPELIYLTPTQSATYRGRGPVKIITPRIMMEARKAVVYAIRANTALRKDSTAAYYGHLFKWGGQVGDLLENYYGSDWTGHHPMGLRLLQDVLRETVIPCDIGCVRLNVSAPSFFLRLANDALQSHPSDFSQTAVQLRHLGVYQSSPATPAIPLIDTASRSLLDHLEWLVNPNRTVGSTLTGILPITSE